MSTLFVLRYKKTFQMLSRLLWKVERAENDPKNVLKIVSKCISRKLCLMPCLLSSEFRARQAQRKVVKITNNYFSYWA